MGNHIIKGARCALLLALQHIKTAASHEMSSKKKNKKNHHVWKIKSETDKAALWDWADKQSYSWLLYRNNFPPNKEYLFLFFSVSAAQQTLFFCFYFNFCCLFPNFDKWRAAAISSLLSARMCWVIIISWRLNVLLLRGTCIYLFF